MIQSAVAFAVAAREAKLESIVEMSQWLSSPSHPSLMTRQTWLTGQLFSMVPGVAHTILNPGWFADNNLRVISFAALLGVFPVLTADSLNAPPATEDIARVAAAVLMDPPAKHAGKTYRPTGPKLLSAYDMVEILSRVLGRRVRALPMPLWMLYKAGLLQGAPKFQMASLRYYIEDHKQGAFALNAPTNDVLEVTGRPAEDFETTVRRYAALPEVRRTPGNTLREFAKFLWRPLRPAYLRSSMNGDWRSRSLPKRNWQCKMSPGSRGTVPREPAALSSRFPPESVRRRAITFTSHQRHTPRSLANPKIRSTQMKQPLFLISGATGITGGYAVKSLLGAGQKVRALVHRHDRRSQALQEQGAEVVAGDFADFRAIRQAMQGVTGAYFCYPIAPGIVQATAHFAQAAKEAKLEAVVNMSQVIAREDARSDASLQHWLSERVLDWSGVPVVHLRPTFFAEWLLYLSPMIAQGTIYAAYGDGKAALISAEDQGRVISEILQRPAAHIGKTYPLYGPVEYTFAEIAAIAGQVLGRTVAYQQVPFEMMAKVFASPNTASGNEGAEGGPRSPVKDKAGENFLRPTPSGSN